MLGTAIKLKPALSMMWTNCPSLAKLGLSEYEWENVEQIYDILVCIKQASDRLAGQFYPTLSSAVSTINILIDR